MNIKNYFIYFLVLIILVFLISGITIKEGNSFVSFSGEFCWPIPNHTYISSYFGRRTSPTSGASSYHSGIDIPAKEGTPIYSICSGKVNFCSWGARWWLYNSN